MAKYCSHRPTMLGQSSKRHNLTSNLTSHLTLTSGEWYVRKFAAEAATSSATATSFFLSPEIIWEVMTGETSNFLHWGVLCEHPPKRASMAFAAALDPTPLFEVNFQPSLPHSYLSTFESTIGGSNPLPIHQE